MSNPLPNFPPNAFLIINGADIYPLKKEYINIGRMDDNDIVLPNAHISRYHAQIKGLDGKFLLVDMQSTSGISVNGNPITSKELAPGDVIMIAGIPLIYGQTNSANKFNSGSEDPLHPSEQDKPEMGATEEVDLSTLDNILDIIDFSEDHTDSPDVNREH